MLAIEYHFEEFAFAPDRLQGGFANLLELPLEPGSEARDERLGFNRLINQLEGDSATEDDAFDTVGAFEGERETRIGLTDLGWRGDHEAIIAATGA